MTTIYINCKDTLIEIINNIHNKKGGIYLRFGDGDFNLAQNMPDLLSRPSITLQEKMQKAMSIRDNEVLICIPHHCKELNTLEEYMFPGHHEYPYDTVMNFLHILKQQNFILPNKIYTNIALSYCSYICPEIVVKLHNEIKEFPVIFIGNENYSNDFLIKLFGKDLTRINTANNNAFEQYNNVFEIFKILYDSKYKNIDFFIIILASGCASRAFGYDLYEQYYKQLRNFYIFDYGSLLDYLNGWKTRANHELAPPKIDYILTKLI